MDTVTLKLKTNCRNVTEIEGYPDKIKFKSAEETENKRDVLSFRLQSSNSNGEKVYITPITVLAYDKRAAMVKEWLKKTLLVTVTGKLRLAKHGHVIIAAYIEKTQPEWADIELEVAEDES